MKKVMLALAAGVLLFASCKKDWTCTCTSGGVSTTITIKDAKKSDASAACTVYEIGGATCELN